MSDEQINYQFVASDESVVERAFSSIAQAAEKSGQTTEKSYKRARDAQGHFIKEGSQGAKKVADDSVASATKMQKAYDRAFAALNKGFADVASAAKRELGSIGKNVVKEFGGSALLGGLKGIFSAAGNFAVSTMAGAVREAMKLDGIAKRISISSRRAGEKFVSTADIRKDLEKAAISNPGTKADEIAGSVDEYRRRRGGPNALAEARQFAGVFATTKSAVGDEASSEEIGKAGAMLAKRFDIKTVDQMGDAMGRLVFAAKDSGQPLSELVGKFDKLASSAKESKLGSGMEGLNKLMALNSIARESVGERQAPTAIAGLLQNIRYNARKIKATTGGAVDPYVQDKSGNMVPIEITLAKLIAHVGSATNMAEKRDAIGKALGGQRQAKAISPLIDAGLAAFSQTKGTTIQKTEAAKTAVLEAFNKAAQAGGNFAELQKDAAATQTSASALATAAMQELQAAVADNAVPVLKSLQKLFKGGEATAMLEPLAVVLTALVEAAGDVVSVFKVIGLIKPKEITRDEKLAKAQRELADYEKKQVTGPETVSDLAVHNRLKAAVEAADTGPGGVRQIGAGRMTQDEFAKRYSEASGTSGEDLEGQRVKGIGLAAALQKDPMDALASNDWLQGVSGENKNQQQIRRDFQGQVSAEGTAPNAGVAAANAAADRANRQLAEMAASAQAAKAALDKLAQTHRPSIVGDHQ